MEGRKEGGKEVNRNGLMEGGWNEGTKEGRDSVPVRHCGSASLHVPNSGRRFLDDTALDERMMRAYLTHVPRSAACGWEQCWSAYLALKYSK